MAVRYENGIGWAPWPIFFEVVRKWDVGLWARLELAVYRGHCERRSGLLCLVLAKTVV